MAVHDITVGLRLTADGKGLVSGVREATGEIGKFGKSVDGSTRSIRDMAIAVAAGNAALAIMKTVFGSVGQVARGLADYADSWSDMTSRVRLSIDEHENAADVMDRLANVANDTYSSMESTAEAFARNSVTLRALGKSTQEQLNYTEALNNALVVSGAKGERAVMVQNSLAKAMATGALRGEELNTVMSYGSRVAELLANELGVSVVELRNVGEEGKITGDVMFNSLVKNMEAVKDEAASMPATIEDGFLRIRNAILQTVGVFDQQNNVSSKLAETMVDVSNAIRGIDPSNLRAVGDAATVLAIIIGSRLTVAAAASGAAFAAANIEALRYQATLARMAGVSASAAAGITAMGVASRAAGAAMTLLGGPAGAAVAAAGAIYYLATRTTDAERAAEQLDERINKLSGSFEKLTAQEARAASLDYVEKIKALELSASDLERQARATALVLKTMAPDDPALGKMQDHMTRTEGAAAGLRRQASDLYSDLIRLNGIANSTGTGMAKMGSGAIDASEAFTKMNRELRERLLLVGLNSEAEKLAARIRAGYVEGITNSEGEILISIQRQIDAKTRQVEAAKKAAEEIKKAKEKEKETFLAAARAHNDAMKEYFDADERALKSNNDAIKSMRVRAEQYEFEATLIGLSNEEREKAVVLHEMEAQAVNMTAEAHAEMEKRVLDALGALQARRRALDVQAEAKRQADQASAEWKRASDDIERSLADALMRGFEGGKGLAENFKDTLKNMFNSLILRPIIQPIAQYGSQMVMGMMGMGGSGAAMAGGMGGSGSSSILSMGSNLYSAYSGIGTNYLSAGMFGTSAAGATSGNLVMAGSQQASMLASQGMGGYTAVTPMAAYGGALGGALYGYEKGGVRGATIGGVAGYAGGAFLAGGASALAAGGSLGAAGAAGMSAANAALANLGPWGWAAIAVLAIFGSGKKKPSDMGAWGDIDLGTLERTNVGSMTGKKYSKENNEFRDATLDLLAGYTTGLKAMGGEIDGALKVHIGSRDGLRADFGADGTTEITRFDSETFLRDVLRELTVRATGLSEGLKGVLVGFDGTVEQLIELSAALNVLYDYSAADPFSAIAEQAEIAGRSAWDVWKQQGTDMRSALAAWDGSAAAATELANLTQSRYQLELQLAQQIHNALQSTSAMYLATAEEMRYSTLDQAEKYDFLRQKSVALEEAMAAALDPAQIEFLAGQLNENTKAAWALLGEEERKIKIDEYEAYLAEIDALTTERLNAAGATITGEHDGSLPDSITAAIEAAMDRAAVKFMDAANAQQAAADTPVTVKVDVKVDSPSPDVKTEVGYGYYG